MSKRKPLVIRGVEYPSLSAAAADLGVSIPAVCNARKRGRLDTVGLDPVDTRPMPITIRGVEYPSQYAAAKALRVTTSTIWNALERGTIDNAGLRKQK